MRVGHDFRLNDLRLVGGGAFQGVPWRIGDAACSPGLRRVIGARPETKPSQGAHIDSADISDAYNLITEHGYGKSQGSQILILANPADGQYIQTWRAGVESRPGGPISKLDFVHSPVAPPYLTQEHIVGQQAPADFHALPVSGSYGRGWLIESNYVLAGYVIVAASGGPTRPTTR